MEIHDAIDPAPGACRWIAGIGRQVGIDPGKSWTEDAEIEEIPRMLYALRMKVEAGP